MRRLIGKCLSTLVFVAGCNPSFDLGSARVSCTSDSGCPAGSVCRATIQRCVSSSVTDVTPPQVLSPVLTPTLGKIGTVFTFNFSVDEALDSAPVVTANASSTVLSFTLDPKSTARAFVYTYTATGNEPQGAAALAVSVVDIYGNAATRDPQLTMTLDFVAPSLTAFAWNLPAGMAAANANSQLPYHGVTDVGAILGDARLVDQTGRLLLDLTAQTALTPDATASSSLDIDGTVDTSQVDLTGVLSIAVALDLADAAGNQVAAALAQTPALPILEVGPTGSTLSIEGKPSVGVQAVTLDLASNGATEVQITGDVVHDTNTFLWIPLVAKLPVTLSVTPGFKTVTATFRDAAYNTTAPVSDQIYLATGDVISLPTLTLPFEQTEISNGDTLIVGGEAEPGGTIVSARMVNVNDQSTEEVVNVSDLNLAADGTLTGSFITSGLVNATSVALEVIVGARSASSIAANSRTLAVTADTVPPTQPAAALMQLVEIPAGNTPALASDTLNTFSLGGATNATATAARVHVYSDVGLTAPVADVTVDALTGGFSVLNLPYNAGTAFYVTAADAAGNTSNATKISVPQFTSFVVAPGEAAIGAVVDIQFNTSVVLAANPSVVVSGRNATFIGLAGSTYDYHFTPAPGDATGTDQAVIRVSGSDGTGAYAAGTQGTNTSETTFDFVAPTLASASITQNVTGTADRVTAPTGSVADDIDTAANVTVTIVDGATTVASGPANALGSFNFSIGDNLHPSVSVRLTDKAGNSSLSAPLTNDIAGPVVSAILPASGSYKSAATISLQFSVQDVHDLSANPVVMFDGRAATYSSGTLTTSDQAAHPFVYTWTVDATGPDPEGASTASISASDVLANPSTTSGPSLNVDKTPPSSSISVPTAAATWDGQPAILGSASDTLSGVSMVEVSISNGSNYWNGASFVAGQTWQLAEGTTDWNYSNAALTTAMALAGAGPTYTIQSRSTDVALNVETPGAGRVFSFDTAAAPVAPTGVTVVVGGPDALTVSWNAVGGAASYNVFYDMQSGSHPPYAGTGATQGVSPVNVAGTSTTLGGLAPGTYVFAVATVDGSGRQSAYSAQVSGTTCALHLVYPLITHNAPLAIEALNSGVFVAVGNSGTSWRSTDGGATWTAVWTGVEINFQEEWTDGSSIFAYGGDGWVLRSDDAGLSWEQIAHGAVGNFYSAATGSGDVLVAGSNGNAVTYSTDGGSSFNFASFPGGYTPTGIAVHGNDVVLVSQGFINQSPDGGKTWSQIGASHPVNFGGVVYAGGTFIAFGEPNAGGNEHLFVSNADGTSWTESTMAAGYDQNQLWTDGTRIFAAGYGSLSSPDAGATWNYVPSGYPLVGVTSSSTTAVEVGSNDILRSTNQGVSWTDYFDITDCDLAGYAGVGPETVANSGQNFAAVGDPSCFVSSNDDGVTWTTIEPPPNFEGVWSDGTVSFVVGDNGLLLRSTAPGQPFTQVASATTSNLYAVAGSGGVVVAVGAGGAVTRSTDNGVSWTPVSSGLSSDLNRLLWGSGTHVVAISLSAMFYSDDAGSSWTASTINTSSVSNFLVTSGNGTNLIELGTYDSGADALLSTDSGHTFNPLTLAATNLHDVSYLDSAIVVVGDAGLIARSPNNGGTWSTQNYAGAPNFYRVWQQGPGASAVVVASGDIMIRSVDEGQTFGQVGAGTFLTGSGDGRELAILGGAGNVLFVADDDYDSYQSYDAGVTWTVLDSSAYTTFPISSGNSIYAIQGFAPNNVFFWDSTSDLYQFSP